MTSKKFPPIPPYYPASSEKWDYPRPGVPAPEGGVRFTSAIPPVPGQDLSTCGIPEGMIPFGGVQYPGAPIPDFQFEGSPVRHKIDGLGDLWFVLADICAILKIRNVSDAAERLDADEKGIGKADTPGGRQDVVMVTESGLYTVTLRCQDALTPGSIPHRFRKWVTSVVLPSIRKTGGYGRQEPAKLPSVRELAQMVIDAEDRAEAAEALLVAEARRSMSLANQNVGLAQELHTSQDLTSRFREGIHMLTALLGTPDGICLQDAANQLGQPQHAFNEWLGAKGKWIYRSRSKSKRWKPHAYAIAKGWLGDKQYIRHKSSMERMLYTPDMGPVDPNEFYIFREVEIMPAGMIRILQYDDHVSPNTPALKIRRQEYGVK